MFLIISSLSSFCEYVCVCVTDFGKNIFATFLIVRASTCVWVVSACVRMYVRSEGRRSENDSFSRLDFLGWHL